MRATERIADFYRSEPVPVRVPGMRISRSAYPPGLRMPRHGHEPIHFSVVLRGGYDEILGSERRACSRWHVLFHPAGEEHAVGFHDTVTEILRIELDPPLLDRLPAGDTIRRPQHLSCGPAAWLAQRMQREMRRNDAATPVAVEGLALELIAETFRQRGPARRTRIPRWLGRAREIVEAQYTDPLTLSLVAGQVNVHPVSLARAFRRHFQRTFGDYLRDVRIRAACQSVERGGETLAEIAARTGFHDQSHFTRVFRQVAGMVPGEYRRLRFRG